MDAGAKFWYYCNMNEDQSTDRQQPAPSAEYVPSYALYGESLDFPDVMHSELLKDRAPSHGWQIAPHRHSQLHQFFLITKGVGAFTIDGRGHEITAPLVISLPKGVVHAFKFAPHIEGFVLTIPVRELGEFYAEEAPINSLATAPIVMDADNALIEMFKSVHAEYLSDNDHRGIFLRALATQIGCVCARVQNRNMRETASTRTGVNADKRISMFEKLVRTHHAARWRVSDYAKALALSPNHLSRLCRTHRGSTPQNLIEEMTFQEACRLLAYTRLSVSEVGFAVGYDDPSYFCRAFKRKFGVTPKAYRGALAK